MTSSLLLMCRLLQSPSSPSLARTGACAVIVVLLAMHPAGALPASPTGPLAAPAAPQIRELPPGYWKDADGNPLPFQSNDEIIDLLRTARVEGVDGLLRGITRPRRVVLEKDGVRVRAVLRDFDEVYENTRISGRFYWRLRDSFLFDLAAYELAELLEVDNVPPVTFRRVGGANGSLQVWVEGTRLESDRLAEGTEPPEEIADAFYRQYQTILIFDTLIGNVDRNAGNLLVDDHWNLWLIDHSRSFLASDSVLPYLENIFVCARGLYKGIRQLDRDLLLERLTPPLEASDVAWILRRRDKVVERLDRLIAERGADAVLYDE